MGDDDVTNWFVKTKSISCFMDLRPISKFGETKRIAKNTILEEGINYTANTNIGTDGQTCRRLKRNEIVGF